MPQKNSPKQEKRLLLELLENSVRKNSPKEEFGILFSGGLDSTLLALLCKRLGLQFKCFFGFVQGLSKPKDMAFAERAAKQLGVQLEKASIPLEKLPLLISQTVQLIGSSSPVQVGVALPLTLACSKAKQQGIKTVFSGMGADELFCGYAKFRKSKDLALDSLREVQQLPKNDLARDQAICAANNLELKTPFLNTKLLKFALSLPKQFKLSSTRNKIILRQLALDLGLPREIAERKKVAAQYGSNSDKAIEKLAKKQKKSKSDYLAGLGAKKKIAALFSGGKDSCLALWLLHNRRLEAACLVSIIPKNSDSFMYHKPNLKILRLQSRALGIPLILKRTEGEKEKELAELELALAEAKKRFGIEGVVSGALYSNYQRERIQRICNSLNLELFSPLWHMGQLEELLELIHNDFVFIFTKIAALGLTEEWLGRPIGQADIALLQGMSKKFGFNVAGEGGEYESLVLDAPNFSERICISRSEKKMENEFTGFLGIREARLELKN